MAASHRVGVSCDSPCIFTMPPPQTLDSGDRVRSPQRVSHGLQLLTRLPDRSPRLSVQRHFCVFAVSFPGQEALITIYNTILVQHLSYRSTPMVIQRLSNHLVTAALGKLRLLPSQPVRPTALGAGGSSHSPPNTLPGKYFIYPLESIFFKRCYVAARRDVKSDCRG